MNSFGQFGLKVYYVKQGQSRRESLLFFFFLPLRMDNGKWLFCLFKLASNNRDKLSYDINIKASISIIIRTKPYIPLNLLLTNKDISKIPDNVDVEILFTKRVERSSDRWSGQVAFPGGKHENNESSYDTAVRETNEEVGLDLLSDNFYYCGRCKDAVILSKTKFNIGVFVFYQCCEITPPLQLQQDEIDSIRWISLNSLYNTENIKRITWNTERRYLSLSYQIFFKLFNIKELKFPGIILPLTNEEYDNINVEYHLWGLTYTTIRNIIQQVVWNGQQNYKEYHFELLEIHSPFITGIYIVDKILIFGTIIHNKYSRVFLSNKL